MRITEGTIKKNFEALPINDFWSKEESDEICMHKFMHTQPNSHP